MTLPKYLYDPDNYVEVLGSFNIIGSASVVAASRVYFSEGGGLAVPATYPGLIIAHNCWWYAPLRTWVADDITKPATIFISGFDGAQSTLWIDPLAAFFGTWFDQDANPALAWQSYPPTGAQLISMPAAGSFHASGNYDWAFPRLITKEIPLHDVVSQSGIGVTQGRILPEFLAPYYGRPTSIDTASFCFGWWPIKLPQDSLLLAAEVMLEYDSAPVGLQTACRVALRGNVSVGVDRFWSLTSPVPPIAVTGDEESTPYTSCVATTNPQVLSIPTLLFIDNTQNDYYVMMAQGADLNRVAVSGIRVLYLEAGIRTPM